jgi:hypothetical protein
MPLHLITRTTPRIRKKFCMNCLHRHFVAYLLAILVKCGPAQYSLYIDLESDCAIFRHMGLWNLICSDISFRCMDFRNGVYLTKYIKKFYFYFVLCSNCSVIDFSSTYIYLFTCNIRLWYSYMNSSEAVQTVCHTVMFVSLYIFTYIYL